MMKVILSHHENMLTHYWRYAAENNKNISFHLLTIKDNCVTVEYKVCIMKRLQARSSPLMWGDAVVIDIIWILGGTLHCWVLPKCSRVTNEKTIYKLQSIFLLNSSFLYIFCTLNPHYKYIQIQTFRIDHVPSFFKTAKTPKLCWRSSFIVSVGDYCICHSFWKNRTPWLLQ